MNNTGVNVDEKMKLVRELIRLDKEMLICEVLNETEEARKNYDRAKKIAKKIDEEGIYDFNLDTDIGFRKSLAIFCQSYS